MRRPRPKLGRSVVPQPRRSDWDCGHGLPPTPGAALAFVDERPIESAGYTDLMDPLGRITHDPAVMGGRPCIRGMRVTVGTILGLLASGHSHDQVLAAYPYLEGDDIVAALSYGA